MKYTDESRFTEDERDAMDGLARVVAFVCGVNHDDLRSKSRKRRIVDARKIASKYAFDNIAVSSSHVPKNIMLPAWYFNVDHSSVCHAVKTADELYEFSPDFAKMYDTVIEIVDNPDHDIDYAYEQAFGNKLTWDEIRMSVRIKNRDKYALLPINIKEDIITLFNKGYGEFAIANKVETALDFISYFIKREGLRKDKMANIRKVIKRKADKFGINKLALY
jgi:hypothetical protein